MELEQIKSAIEHLALLAGEGRPKPRLSFVQVGEQDNDVTVWNAILALGGEPSCALYEYPDKTSTVIESMGVEKDGVEVRIQRSRPPAMAELESKTNTDRHETAFVVSDV